MRYFGFNKPSFSMRRFGFAFSRFAPSDLFANGEQGVWYDPSDKSTLFQDVNGTIPVTKDGDPVAMIMDKSGNGYHAIQTRAASRPIYKTDGILHWLKPDGVDDFFLLPLTIGPILYLGNKQSLVVSTAFSKAISSEVTAILANSDGHAGLDRGFYIDSYLSALRIYIMGSAFPSITQANRPTSVLTCQTTKDGLTTVNLNGNNVGSKLIPKEVYTERPTTLLARASSLGNSANYSGYYDNNFYGLLIVKDPTDAQAVQKIDYYLATKSGVTL